MATQSFMKNITVRTQKDCKSLVRALERSERSKAKDVRISKTVHETTPEQIRKMFGDKNG